MQDIYLDPKGILNYQLEGCGVGYKGSHIFKVYIPLRKGLTKNMIICNSITVKVLFLLTKGLGKAHISYKYTAP